MTDREVVVMVAVFGLDMFGHVSVAMDQSSRVPSESLKPGEDTLSRAYGISRSQLGLGCDHMQFVQLVEELPHIDASYNIGVLYAGITGNLIEKGMTVSEMLEDKNHDLGKKALESLASTMESKIIVTPMLDVVFSLNELHDLYAQMWPECHIDLPNFRRKVTKSDALVDTGEQVNGSKAYTKALGNPRIIPPFSRVKLRRKP